MELDLGQALLLLKNGLNSFWAKSVIMQFFYYTGLVKIMKAMVLNGKLHVFLYYSVKNILLLTIK